MEYTEYQKKLKSLAFSRTRSTYTRPIINESNGHIAGTQTEHADDSSRLDAKVFAPLITSQGKVRNAP